MRCSIATRPRRRAMRSCARSRRRRCGSSRRLSRTSVSRACSSDERAAGPRSAHDGLRRAMEGGLVDRASIARGALVLAIATTACGAPHVALHEAPQAGALRTDRAVLDAWIDRELAPHVPAAVIGIVTQGGVTWQRAVGSRDGRGGPPPDARSVFRIGSLTKLVTAIAI